MTDNEAMQDSGVEWIEAIPQGWKTERISNISLKIGSGITPKGGATAYLESGIPLFRSQNIHFSGLKIENVVFISEETHQEMKGSQVQVNDVLLNITGASLGRCFYFSADCFFKEVNVNQHVCILRPNHKILSKFLYYFLSSDIGQSRIFSSFRGASREGLNFKDIKLFKLGLPSVTEQQIITRYLDQQCGKLDAIIAIKQQQIKTLDVLRQSIIYHAVTKGLDDTAPLVDSGVEWLGKIPQGWKLVRLKSIALIRYGLGQPPALKDDGIPMIRATDISAGKISTENLMIIDPETLPLSRDPYLKEGEIIVVRSGAYTGDSAIVPARYDGAVAGYDMVLTVKKSAPKFISYCLLSSYVLKDQLLLLTLRAAQPHLNAKELGGILLVLPECFEEQQRIAEHLDQETQRLNDLKVNLSQQINTLVAYKKSMIYECVTGKKRIKSDDLKTG